MSTEHCAHPVSVSAHAQSASLPHGRAPGSTDGRSCAAASHRGAPRSAGRRVRTPGQGATHKAPRRRGAPALNYQARAARTHGDARACVRAVHVLELSGGLRVARVGVPRTSLSSPMHRMHFMPCLMILSVLALTSSSLSPKMERRSEWPDST